MTIKMPHHLLLLAWTSLLLLPAAFSFPSVPTILGNPPTTGRKVLSKRAEPTTGDDLPDTDNHPNQLDQVETAFNDALELASYVNNSIDTDTTIFPNYFDEGDRAGVKNVFIAILGTGDPQAPVGNDLLGNLHVQTTDTNNLCGGPTLAYTNGHDTDSPYIVLCPNAFKKKAVTALNGADNPADNPADAAWYISCEELAANGHVSYLMNSLGATLLHEYTHYDALVQSIFGAEIIDQENPDGYGPVNVYNNLPKALSPFNADSYMYYALASLAATSLTKDFH